MKKQALAEKFIELRASDMSITKIAEELNISRTTATEWAKEYKFEVLNAKALRLDGLQEQYCLTMEAKIKRLGELANSINAELACRDLKEVSTDKLLDMLLKVETRLEAIYEKPKIKTESEIASDKVLLETLDGLTIGQ